MSYKSFTLALLFLGACSFKADNVGTKENPLTIYLQPAVDVAKLKDSGKRLADFLSGQLSQKFYGKESGFYVEAQVPQNYVEVVEAIGMKKADLVIFTPFAYVLAKDIKKYSIEAILTPLRDGKKFYQSQIIVRNDGKINSLEDLKDKTFAFTDPASTSGFVFPYYFLLSKGLAPSNFTFAKGHDRVVSMLYEKKVDAGATYYAEPAKSMEGGKESSYIVDARARVVTRYPDVEQKIKILAKTDEIPNEPWAVRTDLFKNEAENKKLKAALTDSLLELSKNFEGKRILNDVSTANGMEIIDDSFYNNFRETLKTFKGLDFEKLLKPAKNLTDK